MASRAGITIAISGSYNGAAMARAEKAVKSLQIQAAASSSGMAADFVNAGAKLAEVGGKIHNAGQQMARVGDTLTTRVTVPMVALGTAAVAASIKYDDAMTDVAKTTNLPREEVERLKDAAIEFSRTSMVTGDQLMQAEALAGQFGVSRDALQSFAEVATGLDISTNMNVEQASVNLAQFANLTQMAEADYERYGSTIVAVGNNMATTESAVSDMAQNIASAGKAAGFSEADIIGLAGSLSSLGLEAQAGGSAISRVINAISKDVATGGEGLEAWASAAHMSADEFVAAWKSDPAEALSSVIVGISQLQDEGSDVNLILEELGVTELRTSDAMRRLSGNTDVLTDGLQLANDAWKQNTALSDEVAAKNESVSAKLQMLRNRAEGVAEKFGGPLVDALMAALDAAEPLLEGIEGVATAFKEADPATQRMIVQLVAMVAAAGPVLSVTGRLTMGVGNIVTGFGKAAQTIGRYSAALGTTNPLVVEAYSQNQTLGTKVALAHNSMVKASGGTKEYMEGLKGLRDMTTKAAKEQVRQSEAYQKTRSEGKRLRMEDDAVSKAQANLTLALKKTSEEAANEKTPFGELRESLGEAASAAATLVGAFGAGVGIASMASGIYEMAIGLENARAGADAAAERMGAFGEAVAGVQVQSTNLGLAFDSNGQSITSLQQTAQTAFSNITGIIQSEVGQWGTLTAEGVASIDEQIQIALQASQGTTEAYTTQMEGIWDRFNSRMGDSTGATLAEYTANVNATYDEAVMAVEDGLNQQLQVVNAKYAAMGQSGSAAHQQEVQATKDAYQQQIDALTDAKDQMLARSSELYGEVTADQQRLWADLAQQTKDFKGSMQDFWSGGGGVFFDSSTVSAQVEKDFDVLIDAATDGTTSAWVSAAIATEQGGGQLDEATKLALNNLLYSFDNLPPDVKERGDEAMRQLAESIEASGIELGDVANMDAEQIVQAIRDKVPECRDLGTDIATTTADGMTVGMASFGAAGTLAVQAYNRALANGSSRSEAERIALEAALGADQAGAFGQSGQLDAAALADAISDYADEVGSAGEVAALSGAEGASGTSTQYGTAGGGLASRLAGGIRGGAASASGAGSYVAGQGASGASGAGSKFTTAGGGLTNSLAGGMTGAASAVLRAANSVSSTAQTPLSELGTKGYSWGSSLAGNIASGMRGALGTVSSAAASVAQTISNYLKHTTPKLGPLSDDDIWGGHMIANYATSMDSKLPELARATNRAASVAAGLADLSVTPKVDVAAMEEQVRAVERLTQRLRGLDRQARRADVAEVASAAVKANASASGGHTINVYLNGSRVSGDAVGANATRLLMELADELTLQAGMGV